MDRDLENDSLQYRTGQYQLLTEIPMQKFDNLLIIS